jgi:hypothetical protein
MTDPASVLRRQLDDLIQAQISILSRPGPLTVSELSDYRSRHNQITTLFYEIDKEPLVEISLRNRANVCSHPSL